MEMFYTVKTSLSILSCCLSVVSADVASETRESSHSVTRSYLGMCGLHFWFLISAVDVVFKQEAK